MRVVVPFHERTGRNDPVMGSTAEEKEFGLERYKFILQQIQILNENVYRFLAIYQTLASALVGAGLTLFVGYRKWGIQASTARIGVTGLMWLITLIAGFTVFLIIAGIFNWLDYRREECDLTDSFVHKGFREAPQLRNFMRWYETHIILFIAASIMFLWLFVVNFILPAMT